MIFFQSVKDLIDGSQNCLLLLGDSNRDARKMTRTLSKNNKRRRHNYQVSNLVICFFVGSYGSMPFTRLSKLMGISLQVPAGALYILMKKRKNTDDFTDRNSINN